MKNKIKYISVLIIITILVNISSNISFAKEDKTQENSRFSINISKDFEKWDQLPEENKDKIIMPKITTSVLSGKESSIFAGAKNLFAKASIPSKYSLTEDIDMQVKDQAQTGLCWAMTATSVLESNLALSSENKDTRRFSARHIDYATSRTFLDGINSKGYNREAGDGGETALALRYFTNGTGAVLEEDMPFENNSDKLKLESIQKDPKVRVTDYEEFPSINKEIDSNGNITYSDSNGEEFSKEEVSTIRNEIKNHIINYGAIGTGIYSSGEEYFNNPSDVLKSTSYYCNDSNLSDHEIAIVGWDDNYSVENFNPEHRPKNPGAYYCLVSWGENSFDKGFLYVSYDDVNIEKNLSGIIGAENITDDQTLYQNDFYGESMAIIAEEGPDIGLANVFTKDSTKDEYVEEVQVSATGDGTAEVYINPTDSSLDESKLQKVEVDSSELDGTFNTFRLKYPIKITGDKFAVVVKIKLNGQIQFGVECNIVDSGISTEPTIFDFVSANPGESFISIDGLKSWMDFRDFNLTGDSFKESNLCVKAITTTNVPDEYPYPDTNTNTNTNTNSNNSNTDNPSVNGGAGTTNNSNFSYNGKIDKPLSGLRLPNTGAEIFFACVLPIVFIISIISFINYRRFKDVK